MLTTAILTRRYFSHINAPYCICSGQMQSGHHALTATIVKTKITNLADIGGDSDI